MVKADNQNKMDFLKSIKLYKYNQPFTIEEDINNQINGNMIKCKDGHIVKSRSEKEIDDFFFIHKIKHIYEKKILGMMCDWYLIDFDIYVEFAGLNNQDYATRMEKKIKRYNQFGLRVIKIYDYNLNNLDSIIDLLERIKR